MVTFVAVAAAIMSLNMLNHDSKRAASIGMPASARTLVWWFGRKEEPQVTLSGLDNIDAGTVTVDGTDLFAMSDAERTRVFDAPLDEVFQYPNGGD